MPGGNKPKRRDRARSWRVARRKRNINSWIKPKDNARKKREKKKD